MFRGFKPIRSGSVAQGKHGTKRTRSGARSRVVVEDTCVISDVLGAGEAAGSSNTPGVAERKKLICHCRQGPLDWSIKTRVQVLSSTPFDWCAPAFRPRTFQPAFESLAAPSRPKRKADPAAELRASLMSWVHPAYEPLRLDVAERRKRARLAGEWEAWGSAFESAYYELRAGRSPYLYLEMQHATMLLLPGDVQRPVRRPARKKQRPASAADTKRAHPRAIFSHSTLKFRAELANAGIEFSQPLRPPAGGQRSSTGSKSRRRGGRRDADDDGDDEESDIMKDLRAIEEKRPGCTRILSEVSQAREERTVRTALVVEGRRHVHTLFNHILNSLPLRSGEPIPTIRCGTPFDGATLTTGTLIKSCETLVHSETKYKIVVQGNFLPCAAATFFALVAREHEEFEALVTTMPSTRNFNMIGLPTEAMGGNHGPEKSTALAVPPQMASHGGMLHARDVAGLRQVSYRSGEFTVAFGNARAA